MIYPGMQYIQLPVKDLYDSLMMLASINAAKDMYEKGLQEMKDFYKEYDDFYSPFLKDMEWYSKNVTGKVRDAVDQLYAMGINPLKSPEAMLYIRRLTNSVDKGTINQMRTNAKIGETYIDSLKKLNTLGKYDPEMEEYYLQNVLGLPSFKDFSTVGESGLNAWTSPSPVEGISLRDLTTDGFAHRTAHDLTPQQAMRTLGSAYDSRKQYKGWIYEDLFNTAGTLVPGLKGDWRGEYFRNLAKEKALARNPEATEADINRQFLMDIAEANRQWLILPTGDLKDWVSELSLALQRENNRLSRLKFEWEKSKYKEEQDLLAEGDLDGVSLFERWYAKGAANAMSSTGTHHNWYDMRNNYGYFGNNAYKAFYDYGQKYTNAPIKGKDLYNYDTKIDFANYLKGIGKREGLINTILKVFTDSSFKPTDTFKKEAQSLLNKYNIERSLRSEKDAIAGFESQFSIPMDEKAVVKSIGDPYKGDNKVAKLSFADIDRLYDVDDVITGTAGYTKRHKDSGTDKLRSVLNKSSNLDITFTPLGTGYSSLRKNTGSFEVNPKGRVEVRDSEGNVIYSKDAYYDIGLGSDNNAGGAYFSNNPILNEGSSTLGSYTDPSNPIKFPIQPTSVGKSYNLYPSYDRWLEYGPRDVRATKEATLATQPSKQTTL